MSKYKIDGVVVPAPNDIQPSYKYISRSYDDASGVFRDKLIRRKRPVKWVYTLISKANYQIIHDIIENKLDTTGSRYFNVTTESPGQGFITDVFYLGANVDYKCIKSTEINGVEFWSFTINWVEVKGKKYDNGKNMPT